MLPECLSRSEAKGRGGLINKEEVLLDVSAHSLWGDGGEERRSWQEGGARAAHWRSPPNHSWSYGGQLVPKILYTHLFMVSVFKLKESISKQLLLMSHSFSHYRDRVFQLTPKISCFVLTFSLSCVLCIKVVPVVNMIVLISQRMRLTQQTKEKIKLQTNKGNILRPWLEIPPGSINAKTTEYEWFITIY